MHGADNIASFNTVRTRIRQSYENTKKQKKEARSSLA
jgi:phosphotransferase system IIB component